MVDPDSRERLCFSPWVDLLLIVRIGPFPFGTTATTNCALVGGVASPPLTVGLYWQSGVEDEFSRRRSWTGWDPWFPVVGLAMIAGVFTLFLLGGL
jgi:hypothetical protein